MNVAPDMFASIDLNAGPALILLLILIVIIIILFRRRWRERSEAAGVHVAIAGLPSPELAIDRFALSPSDLLKLEFDLIRRVNDERVRRQLLPFRFDQRLQAIARRRSIEIRQSKFGWCKFRSWSEVEAEIDRVDEFDSVGGNVCRVTAGPDVLRHVLKVWIPKPERWRAICLRSSLEATAVGLAFDKNRKQILVTQLYVSGGLASPERTTRRCDSFD